MWWIFSKLICTRIHLLLTYLALVTDITGLTVFCHIFWLHAMLDPWHSHAAHHHDYAWTAKWSQNICTLSMPMSLMRPRYDHCQHGWSGHLYGTNGTWKNYPTWFALLDVGFMIILRRTDYFIPIWACGAVSPKLTTVIFQIVAALEQNPKNYCSVV